MPDSSSAATATHEEMANAIRFLAADAVQKANSGHPGMPMGMADVATVLFKDFMKFDPTAPNWADRDRFVLSAGHGSMLLYAVLHLTGYPDMTKAQLENFRQLGSITAGHPEYGHATGIETTTGPLGQGIATSVGMALAERMMAARFGDNLVDHYTYVIAGDGCLMEGISHEAVSMAGHLGLGRLIVLFDDNSISIDGSTDLSVSDDQPARFKASGWHVQSIDGHDPEAIAKAIKAAQRQKGKPSLICCKTTIGFGAPTKAGTSATHGAPLGPDEIAGARKALNWPHAPFEIPASVKEAWEQSGKRGKAARTAWEKKLAKADAGLRDEFVRVSTGKLHDGFKAAVNAHKKLMSETAPKLATRVASQKAIEAIFPVMPEMAGGSVDLTGSNNTKVAGQNPVSRDDFSGAYIYYGVREHGMAAAMNGISLHGGFRPYGGTFMVFTDYCRPSIRLSALMQQPVVYVMTHDSIGLGEDGPTHQPVEHLASLRAMPNVMVMRPCDVVETMECWALALESTDAPSVLALTRQGLPTIRTLHTEENLSGRGAYVMFEAEGGPRAATILATGSEVELAVAARAELQAAGIPTAVVSMPCQELFDRQDAAYKASVLGAPGSLRVSVEAGITWGWERYLGDNGVAIGMTGFGASAPADQLYKHFGITSDAVVEAVKARV